MWAKEAPGLLLPLNNKVKQGHIEIYECLGPNVPQLNLEDWMQIKVLNSSLCALIIALNCWLYLQHDPVQHKIAYNAVRKELIEVGNRRGSLLGDLWVGYCVSSFQIRIHTKYWSSFSPKGMKWLESCKQSQVHSIGVSFTDLLIEISQKFVHTGVINCRL